MVADVRVDVPAESLTTPQRLQLEGRAASMPALDPAVMALDVQVRPPGLDDLRSDATRLREAVVAAGQPAARTSLAVLSASPVTLRAQHWAARVAVHRCGTGESGSEIIALLPEGTVPLGAAIDVGTTKLAAYLVNLETGETVAKGAAVNPQMAAGEDVMSRIAYADAQPLRRPGSARAAARWNQRAARRTPGSDPRSCLAGRRCGGGGQHGHAPPARQPAAPPARPGAVRARRDGGARAARVSI